ncbi:sigma factor-like helix-turn-helix DNA-binding protein [Nonomuraea typhae]|uniref:sigma factor-like helix-turn-helix DNA-binding protein n=1 Tax=Nonomuraea typhae TaxID=2603600 RepID=UPI0012F75180|nr:sigma factor-like helix-turn-helix DNA-binding protein [Nonomuraea typhae]
MNSSDFLSRQFEAHRGHLHSVALRILGSDEAAQAALREARSRLNGNLGGWLTTVVGRICLDMLRARPPLPPGQETALADSVGLALLAVLETLAPDERLALVLHDLFGLPYEEIAPIVERSPAAARELAGRARRRVRGLSPVAEADLRAHRAAVAAFLAAAGEGDFDALSAILAPDVVVRSDAGPSVRGAVAVAGQAVMFARLATASSEFVDGLPAIVVREGGRPVRVMRFTVAGGRIAEIEVLTDPARLRLPG